MVIPAWLQVGGRMHPLLLHFPIALIVLYVLWILFAVSNSHYKQIASDLLLLSSITSVITALCGLLLSREPGYDPDALQTHKWAGSIIAFLLIFWYWISTAKNVSRWFNISASFVMLITIIVAGDLGAAITHGENFLMAPITPEKERKTVLFEEAFVYADVVQPVLEAKCLSCHNSKKAKGELVMETAGLLLKGGKDGRLWDTTKADLGLLMQRIHLPEDEKEHMPPSGKPQLTDEEMVILERWIKGGADMNKKVIELPPSDTLRTIAYKRLKAFSEEKYDFTAANENTIKKLNNTNRVIYPIAAKSPALVVNFYNSPYFGSKQLAELADIDQQVVELNLSKMPVKDEDLKTIARFTNLRTLNLNYSAITGNTLDQLKKLPLLKSLSLTGTAVTAKQLAVLQEFPKLRSVFIWNTGISPTALAAINKQGKIHFETGFDAAGVVMKLTPPIIANGDSIVTKPVAVQLKHYVPGTAIRYTTDGTDPDSISSPIFKNDLQVQKMFELKTRAVKPGWYSSDVVSRYFFTSRYVPDSIELLKPADAKYKAKEGRTLNDLVKSDPGRGSGKWLGFRDNNLEALLFFRQPIPATSVILSTLRDVKGLIFPPASVEIWGGTDKNKLKLLMHLSPKPTVKGDPNDNFPITCEFAPTNVSFIKIIAKPISKIPAWLKDEREKAKIEEAKIKKAELEKAKKEKVKGAEPIAEKSKDKRSAAEKAKDEKPWIFIDEVMVN
ncbi:hypothetical protein SAE01_13190 [Segetibacter aerophilus]|uniref:Cytochrome c domain-containing protein n=2 Tax=Segetibacter aerophilus TaxID=670293 RepID=A0A512BA53_9BACT|nr:hypothetical protein SAE01_13190 [Segetibacter aerophilus]